jgi:predicted Zn-dependent peptidase
MKNRKQSSSDTVGATAPPATRRPSEVRGIERATLTNGVRVVSERMAHVRSVSLGIWIGTGSRRESDHESGLSHFLEHMVFKGTRHRTAEEIAKSIDSIGGGLDAFTGKELVSYNTKVLDEHVPIAFDVLSDLVLNPLFRDEDVEKEKKVILEEIKMDLDSPEYLVHEILCSNFYKGHALGRSIIGTQKHVRSFTRKMLIDYYKRVYEPSNILITAAGNLEHHQILALAEKYFGGLKPARKTKTDPAPIPKAPIVLRDKKALEQVQLYVAAPSIPIAHPDRFTCYVMNTILGGGVSSRLFQNIRERQGLAYAVSSELINYRDVGMLAVYAATSPSTAAKLVRSVGVELHNLRTELVPIDELRRAKDHLKGSLMLSLESTSSRMHNLARQELFFGRYVSLDEMLESVEAVSAEQVRELAGAFFQPKSMAIAMLGPLKGVKVTRADLTPTD